MSIYLSICQGHSCVCGWSISLLEIY